MNDGVYRAAPGFAGSENKNLANPAPRQIVAGGLAGNGGRG